MATRSLNVVISGDATPLKGAFRQAGDSADKFSRKTKEASDRTAEGFKKIHEASKLLLEIGGLSSLAFGLKDVTEEAVKAEAEQKKLKNTIKDAGLSWKAHGKEIDVWLDKTSRASGFVKSDLEAAFGNFIRTTGSVTKAQKLEGEAMDIARSKGISLAGAQSLLARVYNGSYVGLKRLGIAVTPVTKAQDQLKETTKHATDEQKRHAKALDQAATRTSALGIIQEKFGGQSKAFASSTAGSFERAKASLNLFEEQIGKIVLPIMAKAANAISEVASIAAEKWPEIEKTIARVVAVVKAKITDWITKNRGDINSVIKAFVTFGEAVRTVFEKVALPIIRRTVAAIGPIINGLVNVVRGVVRLISGLLSGNWAKAWSGAKEAVSGAWKVIKTVVSTGISDLWTLIKGIGPAMIKLIVKGLENLGKALATGIYNGVKAAVKALPGLIGGLLKGIGHAITHGISSAIGAINPIGDGPGRGGRGGAGLLPSGNVFGGSLMGARSSLAPFAAVGSRFGLHVTDGKRPAGTRTASGGVSYHSTGEAIDMGDGRGPDAQKLGFFRYMKSRFGSRLAELIYTPGGAGIKDGRPYTYTGAVAAEHYDHVHVAYDTGAPGVGDGPGRMSKFGTGDGIGFKATAQLAESVGLPGVTFAQIAHGESDYIPTAIGHDPGGTTGLGLWQITTGYNDDIIAKYGGPKAMLNAHTNALAARDVWRRQGRAAWYGTRYVTGWDLHYKGKLPKPKKGKGKDPNEGKETGPYSAGGSVVRMHNPPPVQSDIFATPSDEAAAALSFTQRRGAPLKGRRGVQKGVLRPGGSAGDSSDPNQPLIDSNNAAAAAAQALADQLAANTAEQKRSNDIANGIQNTTGYQATKFFTDLLSGQVVRGVVGRNFTPGTAVEVAY